MKPTSEREAVVETRRIKLADIITDAGTQMRVAFNQAVVDEYAELYRETPATEKPALPPLVVFTDSRNYWLADGFHRLAAGKQVGYVDMVCDVRAGTLQDAIDFACQANDKHGLRPSREDRQKAVAVQLRLCPERSDREIGRLCGVDNKTVGSARAKLESREEIPHVETRRDNQGRQQPSHKPPGKPRGAVPIEITPEMEADYAAQQAAKMPPAETPKPAEVIPDMEPDGPYDLQEFVLRHKASVGRAVYDLWRELKATNKTLEAALADRDRRISALSIQMGWMKTLTALGAYLKPEANAVSQFRRDMAKHLHPDKAPALEPTAMQLVNAFCDKLQSNGSGK